MSPVLMVIMDTSVFAFSCHCLGVFHCFHVTNSQKQSSIVMVPVAVSCVLNFQKRDTRVFHLNSSHVVPLIVVPGCFGVTSAGMN